MDSSDYDMPDVEVHNTSATPFFDRFRAVLTSIPDHTREQLISLLLEIANCTDNKNMCEIQDLNVSDAVHALLFQTKLFPLDTLAKHISLNIR